MLSEKQNTVSLFLSHLTDLNYEELYHAYFS